MEINAVRNQITFIRLPGIVSWRAFEEIRHKDLILSMRVGC